MFDPVTISAAVATASTAFNGIKRAFQAGRDLESMSQDLSRWMGAVSDVDAAHKSAKNPTMFRKVFSGGSIEQEAIEAFTPSTPGLGEAMDPNPALPGTCCDSDEAPAHFCRKLRALMFRCSPSAVDLRWPHSLHRG